VGIPRDRGRSTWGSRTNGQCWNKRGEGFHLKNWIHTEGRNIRGRRIPRRGARKSKPQLERDQSEKQVGLKDS